MLTISTSPKEKGTAIVSVVFTDETGATITPTVAAWQLQRTDGAIVNNRSFANCPITGTEIVLSGLDLAIFGISDNGVRIFSVQGLYDSDAGIDLPVNDEAKFKITRLMSQIDESL